MKFFSEDSIPEEIQAKIDLAPLTNSGSESNFSQLDLECRRGSGQTKLETMSNRHMVKGNKYFESDHWKEMSPELKEKEWNYARGSPQAKIVRDMKNEFLAKVKAAEKMIISEKIKKKQRKNERSLKLLESVKSHGGPIASNDGEKLQHLEESQLLNEVRYLRQTVAPNIREKRKVDGKFVKYSKEELISQIQNVLKPETEVDENVDSLLLQSLVKRSLPVEVSPKEPAFPISSVALLEGALGDRRVGVAVTSETIQMYHLTRYGFEPDDTTEDMNDWNVVKIIEDYDFVKKRTGVYMVCAVD